MHPANWWASLAADWMWILTLGFLALCILFFLAYLARGPRWFLGRSERRILHEAACEILDRRLAGGEITKEQYEEMKRVLAG